MTVAMLQSQILLLYEKKKLLKNVFISSKISSSQKTDFHHFMRKNGFTKRKKLYLLHKKTKTKHINEKS